MKRVASKRSGSIAAVAMAVVSTLLLAGCSGVADTGAPEPLSADERVALYDSLTDDLWAGWPGAFGTAPESSVIRVVDADDWTTVMRRCLREAGVDVGVYGDSLTYQEQTLALGQFATASYVCQTSYPTADSLDALLSSDERSRLWHYYSAVAQPCLRSAGHPVEGLPPLAEFLEPSLGGVPWHPMTALILDGTDTETLRYLENRCVPEPEWAPRDD